MREYLLGFDVGSSSVKASLVEVESGACVASAFYPKQEAEIIALESGWAEQDPQTWWEYAKMALMDVKKTSGASAQEIKAIGISYQMHGLVCVDKDQNVLRNAIIWCDSRAVSYGEKAFSSIGEDMCLEHLLNSPGNFTASKLAWVRENEPQIFEKIYKVMLPGDYLAMKLSQQINTTISGLSEGMLWDFKERQVASVLLDYYGIPKDMLADITPTFSIQSTVCKQAAEELGLQECTPISYRAGDQPNNALSLNVLRSGEIASTAGTSGVIYGVLDKVSYDKKSRVNTFAHVNYTDDKDMLGVLLCINGTGCLNSWMHRNVAKDLSYPQMNDLALQSKIGSEGLSIIPFGNGAERVMENKQTNCSIHGLDFNRHNISHLLRATQEGIVFSFCYGMEVMQAMGMNIEKIHAGKANMFLSPLFAECLATTSGASIELYETDGSVGAAKGAGIGAGIYKDSDEAFSSLKRLQVIEPNLKQREEYLEAYNHWKEILEKTIR